MMVGSGAPDAEIALYTYNMPPHLPESGCQAADPHQTVYGMFLLPCRFCKVTSASAEATKPCLVARLRSLWRLCSAVSHARLAAFLHEVHPNVFPKRSRDAGKFRRLVVLAAAQTSPS